VTNLSVAAVKRQYMWRERDLLELSGEASHANGPDGHRYCGEGWFRLDAPGGEAGLAATGPRWFRGRSVENARRWPLC